MAGVDRKKTTSETVPKDGCKRTPAMAAGAVEREVN
jgi:hypothetical protein